MTDSPATERARIQVELWDKEGPPEPEHLRERAETLIDILIPASADPDGAYVAAWVWVDAQDAD